MGKIFISYRREDSIETTGRIYDWLDSRLPSNSIFMDVETVMPGTDFRVAIEKTITSASVVLVIIGPRWLTIQDINGGQRIDNPNDFVRTEIELAIQQNIPIIPILVQDAKMPSADQMPAPLIPLVYRNAVKARPNPDFAIDMHRIRKGIESVTPEIIFSEVSENTKSEQTTSVQTQPTIPDGSQSEYGFYYTKVIQRTVAGSDQATNNLIVKEFALSDSPTVRHRIRVSLVLVKYPFSTKLSFGVQLYSVGNTNLTFVDRAISFFAPGTWLANVDLVLDTNKANERYSSDYFKKSITLDGHDYECRCQYVVDIGSDGNYTWRFDELLITVDGYTILDKYNAWP